MMKVVILAGGVGSRLAEETEVRPKPLVEIGERPILWHVMMTFAHYGMRDFYIALGYKGDMIKRYFLDYYELHGDLKIDLTRGPLDDREQPRPDWRVNLCDTGRSTNTGGRVRRLRKELEGGTF